ncbi:DUF4062 domain-containing protein [Naasia sp. SYSU D00948]|uniref:DUF4062 domain-containing protein n=1 Tax=Naasia sp. SYSU D00948 TaxID=2817379 RepID=UPI001B312492|nr:DUF4062 domain-containing protein [Naasia sp. SYSU D00948]
MTTLAVGTRAGIRTPDQRLRVFVSSTLKELAPERKAVRRAIERLAAAPVMFELGARPHPPRELYRAYLEQSDVFVGLYWEKYGWVAPGETVSGLEDEYNLVPPGMPRLVYIKESAGGRESRLLELLDRIRSDDRASFTSFSDAEELGELVVADLAVLLAERFDQSRPLEPEPGSAPRAIPPPEAPEPVSSLPSPLTRLFGREGDVQAVLERLRTEEVRLLTVTGPGGIGKTRLAIEAARQLAPEFPDGAVFVQLAAVEDAARVPDAVAQALGLRETKELSASDAAALALRRRELLLVLDNFEQVLDAAPFVSGLLEAAPGVTVLVTSRTLLRVGGEYSLEVAPLQLPKPRRGWPRSEPPAASVALLVDRARAVRPDFELTAGNIDAVEGIASRLEGVPLALELAAARLRVLSPESLLERLDHQLALLAGGRRDLPPRQQAVRSTIEWSTRLLRDEERELLWRLGVFAGPFLLESAEALSDDPAGVLPLLEALVDASLVRQRDRGGTTYFLLLATVREYALEQLHAEGLLDEMRDRHAECFLRVALDAGPALLGASQGERAAALAELRDNLRATARHLLDRRRFDDVAEFTSSLLPYWWIDGLLTEARGWMNELLDTEGPLPERTRAIAIGIADAVFFWREASADVIAELAQSAEVLERGGFASEAGTSLVSLALAYTAGPERDLDSAVATLDRALRLARRTGNRWGESLALTTYGGVLLAQRETARAVELFTAALRLADELQDYLLETMARNNLAWAHLVAGDTGKAASLFGEVLTTSMRMSHEQGTAASLEGFFGIASTIGDPERAGALAAAAEGLRERLGVSDLSEDAADLLQLASAGENRVLFERGADRGRRMPVEEAIALAREVAASVTETREARSA